MISLEKIDENVKIPNIKAIVGDSIGTYKIHGNEDRGLVHALLRHGRERRESYQGTPFTFTHINGVGLAVKLNSWGENFVYDQIKNSPRKQPFPNMEKHFNDEVPSVRAIVGDTIGIYPVSYTEARQVVDTLHFLNKDQGSDDDRLFSYVKDKDRGLIMKLTPHGENTFLEMDVLDERIRELYKYGRFESFDEETAQTKDIIAIERKSGIATMVGGERRTTSYNEQTMFNAPVVPESYVSAAELFDPQLDAYINKHGQVKNDTHEVVMQHFYRGSFVSDVKQGFSKKEKGE